MGKIKYIDKVREFFKINPVVSISSIKKFINKKEKDYVYLLVNNLLKKNEIKRITKSFYTIYEDTSLIVFCFKPSYLGLQDALSIHNLWEQETNPIVITTKKVRNGVRKVFGNNAMLRRISPRYFFGFEYKKDGDFYFPVSDIEKTLIDLVYFRQSIDKETIKEIKKRIDRKKLNSYLIKYPKRTRTRVLKVLNNTK